MELSKRAWLIWLTILAACFVLLALLPNADARADPDGGGVGNGPGQVRYCPDSGRMVGIFGVCPSRRVGPYSPGGLEPDDHDD